MTTSLHAPILWAQRDTILYVTIAVEEVKIEQLNVTETGLQFKGSTAKGEQYETSFEFFAAVDGEKFRRYGENTRYTELIIPKKEAGWWPRLLKDKGKVGWLKVNFDKWVDEDEQDENEPAPGPGGDFDLSQYMSQMGAGGNMPPDLDGFDADEDEDDDDVPDLEDADEADAKRDGEQKEEKAVVAETNGTGN